ncbi:hypothetical protein GQ457_01G032040 [Hibiscus cannabinus]
MVFWVEKSVTRSLLRYIYFVGKLGYQLYDDGEGVMFPLAGEMLHVGLFHLLSDGPSLTVSAHVPFMIFGETWASHMATKESAALIKQTCKSCGNTDYPINDYARSVKQGILKIE